MRKYILLLLLLIFTCSEFDGKEVYLITTPNTLLSEANHTINVYVSTNVALVIESVHLKSGIKNSSGVILLKNGIHSIPYVVPFVGPHLGDALKLRFLGDNCTIMTDCETKMSVKGVFINESRELDILRDNFIIFTETDKPIYKPGDTVKLRAMAIYPTNLMSEPPASGQAIEILFNKDLYDSVPTVRSQRTNFNSITVENPDNLKMAQWLNVSFDQAMKLTFSLSNDPVFGKWTIITKLNLLKEMTLFTVKKYVLPRFVVDVYPPTSILQTDKTINFKVCASYTTGKTMEAIIRGKLCLSIGDKICRVFASYVNGSKKCSEISLHGAPFGLGVNRTIYYSQPVFVTATVNENGTNIAVTKNATGPSVKNTLYEIKFIGKEYFKPGLPYFGQLKLTRHDGKPQKNTEISLTADTYIGNNWGFQKNFTSNKAGKIKFIIPHIPINARLYLRFEGTKGNNVDELITPTLYKNLAHWESIDNEFIQISPLYQKIKCPGTLQLTVLTNGDVSTNKIIVQIFSRGVIQSLTEYQPVPVKCVGRNDHLGHYKCVENNKVKCLEGWKGGSCREPVCIDGCVMGACISPNVCACKNGWTGRTCGTCVRASYCENGFCKRGLDCLCRPGWTGYKCDTKGPIIHKYIDVTDRIMTTVAPKSEPMFQNQTIFERSINITIGKNMGPDLHIVVFYINRGSEVVADSIEIAKVSTNCSHLGKGTFRFNQGQAIPRDNITLSLNPGTVRKSCALRISDAALSQFGQSSNVNIFYLINKLIEINHKITKENSRRIDKKVCYSEVRVARSAIWPWYGRGYDSRKAFVQSGLTPITNARVVNSRCRTVGYGRQNIYADSAPMNTRTQERGIPGGPSKKAKVGNGVSTETAEIKKQIRDFFPETWVFDYYNVTPSQLNLTVPDSMTSWKANSYCMTEKGIWIAPTQLLTVILPFFVDIYVPYSIKIGERLELPVKLFNYVEACYEIKSTLNINSSEIEITGPKSFTACLCSDDVRTIYFDIKAKVMGKLNVTVSAKSQYSTFCSDNKRQNKIVKMSDTIRRQLLVEPPGIPSETTFSELICNRKEQLGLKSTYNIPTKIVPGSLRSYLVFNGDAMGQTFDNLDRLVKMPYGCGEQNMVALVPSIYVLDYLSNLNIEDPILVNKAKRYISEGYKRQLTYKHNDGSYSAFGKNDKSGSTWLTAFVLRSFTDASKYIPIDSNILKESVNFLERMQSSNGCFKENGTLLSGTMAGGLKNKGKTDESLLTAYILIALKKIKTSKSTFNISSAKRCVALGLNEAASTYRLALSVYALSLYEPDSTSTINLMKKLKNVSISSGRYRYWKSGLDNTESLGQFNSADVETTGYALLALQDFQSLSESLATIYWLSNQRSSLGGYYSTQDTIVALNTIAVFAEKIGVSPFEKLDLQVVLDDAATYIGSLTKSDRLVTRKISLGSRNISYVSVKTNGTGCLSIQLVSLYNIEQLFSAEEEFRINVKSSLADTMLCTVLKVKVCSSYLRKDRDSNMILITVDFPSGWELTNTEKDDLLTQIVTPLKRIDFLKDKMHLYYDSFSYADESNERCFEFSLFQASKVKNLKPSFVRMVDYYKPEIYTDTSYLVPMNTRQLDKTPVPGPSKTLLCPRCLDNSNNSVSEFRSMICPWSFAGLVMAGNKTLKNRIFYESKYQVFYEWTLDLEPSNCSCLRSWSHINDDFVVLSSQWMWLKEKLTFSNESVLFPKSVLYEAFMSDLGNSCSIARDMSMMAGRIFTDFDEETSVTETCPSCILKSNLYFMVKNITSFICSKSPRWSLTIETLNDSILNGTLSNSNNETIVITTSFSMSSCFCFQQLQNLDKRFEIVGNFTANEPFTSKLDDKFQIVESAIYSTYRKIEC